MTTMAAIDRVVHHSVILDMMEVESYRAHQAYYQHSPQSKEGTNLQKKELAKQSHFY